MAEVMVPRALFQQILHAIAALRPEAPGRCGAEPSRVGDDSWAAAGTGAFVWPRKSIAALEWGVLQGHWATGSAVLPNSHKAALRAALLCGPLRFIRPYLHKT
jgi:hypothetical protein